LTSETAKEKGSESDKLVTSAFEHYIAAWRNTGGMDAEGMPANPEALKTIIGKPLGLVLQALSLDNSLSDESFGRALKILEFVKGYYYAEGVGLRLERRELESNTKYALISKIMEAINENRESLNTASLENMRSKIKRIIADNKKSYDFVVLDIERMAYPEGTSLGTGNALPIFSSL